ncbi:roadblock/LC7 domain-containing protein [Streptomyces niveus]|uniref:roadblock/LC7 domain-containing protein n=1 Tax=Streptomyces niveus TaxID=193462 RepID=UPI00364726B7
MIHSAASQKQFHSAASQDELSWVLQPLLALAGVTHAVVLSNDGMLRGGSPDLPQAARESVAAMMASHHGSSRALLSAFSGKEPRPVRQMVVEDDAGIAFATSAAENSILVVYGSLSTNLGEVAHQMQIQVHKLGKEMESPARGGASA